MSYPQNNGFDISQVGPKVVLGVVGIFIAITLLISATTIVQPGNRGVLVTLGKVSPNYLNEGIHFKIPFIQNVEPISIRQRTQAGVAATFSKDLQTVTIEFDALYRVPPAAVVDLYQNYSGVIYDSLLEPRIQEQMKQACAQYRAEDLVQNRENVKVEVVQRVREVLGDLLIINDLTISNIDLTDELEASIEQKQIAEQEAQKMVYRKEQAELEAEVKLITAKADAEAARIIGETLRANPQVIDMEIAKKWDGKAPTSLVTGSGGSNILLPLR